MTTNLNPAIAASLRGFIPSSWTANPVADASEHFDNLADTFSTDVNYLGLSLTVEVNRAGHLVDVVATDDGTGWRDELSERALRKILALACEAEAA